MTEQSGVVKWSGVSDMWQTSASVEAAVTKQSAVDGVSDMWQTSASAEAAVTEQSGVVKWSGVI